MTCVPIHPGVP